MWEFKVFNFIRFVCKLLFNLASLGLINNWLSWQCMKLKSKAPWLWYVLKEMYYVLWENVKHWNNAFWEYFHIYFFYWTCVCVGVVYYFFFIFISKFTQASYWKIVALDKEYIFHFSTIYIACYKSFITFKTQ